MAYCDKCGAYIPDGQTKCLACGFDEAEAQRAAAEAQRAPGASGAAGRFDSDFLRRQLEQQRARQKENSKKWAEAERARRQQQQEKQAESYVNRGTSTDAGPGAWRGDLGSRSGASASGIPNKAMAVMSYLGVLCFVPMLACPGDDFAMYHARQGLGLFLCWTAGSILGSLLGVGWLVSLAGVYMMVKGISTASAGKKIPLPYIGTMFLKK